MAQTMRRVLVADDSITVRTLIAHVLEARGVRVLAAQSGTEAIEQIERERPDLVISDVVMPDKSGYEICDFVRKHPRLSSTPVLLISGVLNAVIMITAVSGDTWRIVVSSARSCESGR